MLTDSASEFFPKLADFYAFLAEIRNCPGVTLTIRFEAKGKMEDMITLNVIATSKLHHDWH
jgi:hypothetical protein